MKRKVFVVFLLCLVIMMMSGCASQKEKKMVEPIQTNETEKRIVAIRVVDNQQQAIQGAVIRLDGLRPINSLGSHHGLRDASDVEFMTDSTGIAQVAYPRYVYERVETGAISFHLSHPDYAEMRVTSYKIDGSEGPVVISPGAELVAVALLDGAPVKEFKVLLESSEFKRQIKEGTDGRLIRGIKEETYPIYFSYIDGTGREYYSAVEIFEAKAGMSHQIELPLYPALSLKGILDPSIPRPIKNGRVQVNMINETKSMEGRVDPTKAASVHRTFTADVNTDGSFLFPQLPRGYGEIIAICDGFVSKIDRSKDDSYFQNQHFDLQSDEQEIVVEMEPTATFSGKVVNADGQAIGGVKVVFSPNVFWGNFISQLFMGPPYKDIQRELKSRDLTEVPMDKLQELMLRYTPSATTDAKGEFSVVNLPGHRRESYIVWSANYELPIETVENRPPRREREVDLRPDEEIYEVIQIVPKGQEQIEASDGIIESLIKQLSDNNVEVRRAAVSGLISNYKSAKNAVPALIKALRDSDVTVSTNAAIALGIMGNPAAVPALEKALRDERESVRTHAAQALGRMGGSTAFGDKADRPLPARDAAVSALIRALRDENEDVSNIAAWALSGIGESAKDTVPALIEALKDEDDNVRRNAAEVLKKIGTPEALKAVEEWEKDR